MQGLGIDFRDSRKADLALALWQKNCRKRKEENRMGAHVGCTGSTYRPVWREQSASTTSRCMQIATEIVIQAACMVTILTIVGTALRIFG
jgi:hypothetical protein